jgi:hypothetical protein
VVPAFVTGVPGSIGAFVRAQVAREAAGEPITITFGAPMDLGAYFDAPAGPRTSLRIAQAVRAEIERLGATDRDMRAARAARSTQAPRSTRADAA